MDHKSHNITESSRLSETLLFISIAIATVTLAAGHRQPSSVRSKVGLNRKRQQRHSRTGILISWDPGKDGRSAVQPGISSRQEESKRNETVEVFRSNTSTWDFLRTYSATHSSDAV